MPATRVRRARLGDVRLWLGLALVIGSVLLGARLMTPDDNSVVVLRASRDLAVGSTLDGLEPVRISRSAAGNGYLTSQPASGDVLRWPVAAGDLVPRSAVVEGRPQDSREVTIPVDPLHAPPGLIPGDLVDVWSSPRENESGDPTLVLSGVTVGAVESEDVGISGEIGVVLNVPAAHVVAVVQASRVGVVDLVAIPIGSQPLDVDALSATGSAA